MRKSGKASAAFASSGGSASLASHHSSEQSRIEEEESKLRTTLDEQNYTQSQSIGTKQAQSAELSDSLYEENQEDLSEALIHPKDLIVSTPRPPV